AIPTGSTPSQLHEALAQRAEAITRRDPKQAARAVFLDHVTGKLPIRYRETPEGLALITSIAHVLTRDEPWEASDHDYGEIVHNMVARELSRTPAVDLADLATSLIGSHDQALDIVAEAAEKIAAEDPEVRLYSDGIMVRALAQREDPDQLYKLRGALEARLGRERAGELIRALITAKGDENHD
ncbi:MAG: hypothetical protein R3185_02925, partial [Candidatus Thermoplasmatota archaeon]|nr:hypothetical protein [Candidatus Thermoplasmatota archaeon]